MVAVVLLVFGLVVLTFGAEILVRGASKVAAAAGISSLAIGLTVVAFGTSAPEMIVSLQSAWRGQSDIALGNVVGSNIFNVLVILGISALIIPLAVAKQLIRIEVPLMIMLSLLVWLMAIDGQISRFDGLFLSSGLIAYTWLALWQGRREQAITLAESGTAESETMSDKTGPGNGKAPVPINSTVLNISLIVLGLALLAVGSHYFVESAVMLARWWGVSELVIGLTIVAAGTSLPEVATSVMAALRGERDIAVGNVLGSNLFNILGVLGISSTVSASGILVSNSAFSLDLPVMLAVAVVCWPILLTGGEIKRWEGAVLLTSYFVYVTYMILLATDSPYVGTMSKSVIYLGLPVIVIVISISIFGHFRRPSAE